MHIRHIIKTELNGMILQHTQSLPQISYNGCVICFINYDGYIQSVGTRIVNLNVNEFEILKKLISKIKFEDDCSIEHDYTVKKALKNIKTTISQIIKDFDGIKSLSDYDLGEIRNSLIEVENYYAMYKD